MEKAMKYATATAFRRALEDRLGLISAQEALPIERLRREAALLARPSGLAEDLDAAFRQLDDYFRTARKLL